MNPLINSSGFNKSYFKFVRYPIIVAGTPATIAFSGTLFKTTAPFAIIALLPTFMGPQMIVLCPIKTWSPMMGTSLYGDFPIIQE